MNRAGRQRSARGIDEGWTVYVQVRRYRDALPRPMSIRGEDNCFASMVLRSSILDLPTAARERDSAAHEGADDWRHAATIHVRS
jgi:hypothetical protein